jgi:hypothetical protein
MNLIKLVFWLAFVLLMVMAGPWCLIWAINTLVAAGGVTTFFIPFDFYTWLAALLLGGLSIIPKTRRG